MRALIAILPLFTALQAEPILSLMPVPAHVSLDQGKLTIDGSFGVRISGHTDRRLQDAVTRFIARLSRQMGQLERLISRREHGLELYAGGKGHGEPPCIDWAHDYVDQGGFQKLRRPRFRTTA